MLLLLALPFSPGLSCAEFFGFNDGKEWFITHYLFQKN